MWKILTYNIHGGVGMDRVLDLSRIAVVIKKHNTDFICLNEVDVHCVRTNRIDTLSELERLLDIRGHFACALKMSAPKYPEQGDEIGEYGNAFLSPHRFEIIKEFMLPGLPEMEPRICTVALIHAPQPFYAVATHFCWEPKYAEFRIRSVQKIIDETKAFATNKCPVILCGDLNANPTEPEMELLRKSFLLYGEKNGFMPTHPADTPTEIIDYICVAPKTACRFSKTEVIHETLASDHRPLFAEITM